MKCIYLINMITFIAWRSSFNNAFAWLIKCICNSAALYWMSFSFWCRIIASKCWLVVDAAGNDIVISRFVMSIWWRHQMETFSASLALCEGNPPVTGGFPSQRPVTRSLVFSLICAWTNGWANAWDAGDLRPHRARFDCNELKGAVIGS